MARARALEEGHCSAGLTGEGEAATHRPGEESSHRQTLRHRIPVTNSLEGLKEVRGRRGGSSSSQQAWDPGEEPAGAKELPRPCAGDSSVLMVGPQRKMSMKLGQTPSVIFGRSSGY